MDNKDYIEICDENNNIKKMEIVLMFQVKENLEYNYIIYREFEGKELYGGKIKIGNDMVLETNLTETEKKMVEQNLKKAFEINKKTN